MTPELPRISQKWGFGMAPEKPSTRCKREASVANVISVVQKRAFDTSTITLESISEVKGLFTRAVAQDQWDWFVVWMKLGRPGRGRCRSLSSGLKELRANIKNGDREEFEVLVDKLLSLGLLTGLSSYLADKEQFDGAGCIYILSTREIPSVLKIGFTRRDPASRVREINQATGVLVPFGVRAAWRVDDPEIAERDIHALFQDYRIRADREFFHLHYQKACSMINDYLLSRGDKLSKL